MKETQAIIERVRRVNTTHQHLILAVDPSLNGIMAGQSVLARVHARHDPYLREQWYPVDARDNQLVIERPADVYYEPGETVDLLGIVGQPLRFRRTLRNVLFIACDTEPTPLLMPFPSLIATRVSVTLVLLGRAADYETEHLSPEVEILRGDADLNFPNRVTTIGWADQVFVAVSNDNESAAFLQVWALFNQLRAEIPSNYLFGVFRPPLPCGVGACTACMLKLKTGTRTVCTDGAAIDLTEAVLT